MCVMCEKTKWNPEIDVRLRIETLWLILLSNVLTWLYKEILDRTNQKHDD